MRKCRAPSSSSIPIHPQSAMQRYMATTLQQQQASPTSWLSLSADQKRPFEMGAKVAHTLFLREMKRVRQQKRHRWARFQRLQRTILVRRSARIVRQLSSVVQDSCYHELMRLAVRRDRNQQQTVTSSSSSSVLLSNAATLSNLARELAQASDALLSNVQTAITHST